MAHQKPQTFGSLGALAIFRSTPDSQPHQAADSLRRRCSVALTAKPRLSLKRVSLAPADCQAAALAGRSDAAINTTTMAALGWERYHLSIIETMAESNKEQIGSLGWDGPLAAISQTRVNLADYFKETVAVVTNPAIDRERERAQFSTTVILGARPDIGAASTDFFVQLDIPLLLGGHPDLGSLDDMRAVAQKHGTMTLEDLVETFGDRVALLSTSAALDESIQAALERLQAEAVAAVVDGVACIVLDDTEVYGGGRLWIDPLLVVAALDRALREAGYLPNLRRQVGIVLRSGAMRDLHDVVLAFGLGANALVPYALYAVGLDIAPRAPREAARFRRSHQATQQHHHRARRPASRKSPRPLAATNCAATDSPLARLAWRRRLPKSSARPTTSALRSAARPGQTLQADAEARAAELRGKVKNKLDNPDRLYPEDVEEDRGHRARRH